MSQSHVDLLASAGDGYEREGCQEYQLNKVFPRYAEIWATYIVPLREPQAPERLQSTIPIELEYLFMSHYSVWYHLTVAHRYNRELANGNPRMEIGEPFYHLVSATDMAHQVLGLALTIQSIIGKPLPLQGLQMVRQDSYHKRHAKAWETKFFESLIPQNKRKDYQLIRNEIREYRNTLTHAPMIARLLGTDGKLLIPARGKLQAYSRWSSVHPSVPVADFELPSVIFESLTKDLVHELNNLWEILVIATTGIFNSSVYSSLLKANVAPSLNLLGNTADIPTIPSGVQPPLLPLNSVNSSLNVQANPSISANRYIGKQVAKKPTSGSVTNS